MPLLLSIVLVFHAGAAFAANEAENRLRDALRSLTVQARSLEDQLAAARARQAALEQERDALKTKVEQQGEGGMTAEQVAQREAEFRAVIGQFEKQAAELREANTALAADLAKQRGELAQAGASIRAREAERRQLVERVDAAAARVAQCVARNGELFKVGSEILERYARFGFSDSISAREPFVGFKRVELQNLVQDYEDRLLDQKIAK